MNSAAPESASVGPEGSGARRRLSLGAVLGIMGALAAVLAVIDQITKNWAEANLEELVPQPFVGEILQLTLLYNSGAAWGMGSEITPVVTGLQIAIALGVVVFAIRAVRSPWYAIALGMVLGGALGNVHDRLLRAPAPFHGEVVDFLELPNWPVFNIADMAVVGGAILIVALGLFGRGPDPAGDGPVTHEAATDEAASHEAATDEAPTHEAATEETATDGPGAEREPGSRPAPEERR